MLARLPAPVWLFAAVKVVFHLATTRLGFHRDELYFISASERLSASFVDFQPVTPVLVRIEREVFGDSLLGLRLIPALAGAIVVILAAVLAREMGGDRRAQVFAAFTVLIVPFFVGANSALNTITLEIPAWMLVAVVLARIERTDNAKLWVWAGLAIGAALLVKFTVLAYLAGIPIAIAATRLRRHLSTPWPWIGGLLAVAIVAPSVLWQISHDLPVLEFVRNQSGGGKVLGLSGRAGFLASLVIFPGPIGLIVVVAGFRRLLRDGSLRAIAIVTAVPLVIFLAVAGKGYYASPALAVSLTAGAIGITQRWERVPRLLVAGLIVNLLVALPLLVPLVPTSLLREQPDIAAATEMGERIGWEQLADDVARIARDVEDPVVLGSNYTIPSAVEFYRGDELPVIVSGHNSSYLWWPPDPGDHTAIAVGLSRTLLEDLYEDVRRAGTVRNREGVENYEWEKPIFIARGPKVSWSELREALRIFTA